ncbi:MAG TPA: BTAD domain-containing putative transcriptional regulator [Herpetosiphonaceae bacterium]
MTLAAPSPLPSEQADPPLRLRLFGSPGLSWQGTELSVRRRQIRALLFRLGVELAPVPRAELCYLFWPDIPDAAARRNLTHLLTHARQALPEPAALRTTQDYVNLDPQRAWSDTAALGRLLAQAERERRSDLLEQAADLIAGPFLDGFSLPAPAEFAAWADQERARWERRALAALASAFEHAIDGGGHAAALRIAQRYLALDPTAEEMHRHAISLHVALGDERGAERHFAHCRATLRRELGVEPAAATLGLIERLRRERAARAGDSPPLAGLNVAPRHPGAPGLPLPLTPLIGREDERASLCALLLAPERRLITVCGMGGVGKTALAIAAAQQAAGGFAHGAQFIDLTPARRPEDALLAIAEALGAGGGTDEPALERLIAALAGKRMLLVLDNLEQVAEVGPQLSAALRRAPGVTILATSRRLLRVTGEHVFSLGPLALGGEQAADGPALRLFVERARAQLPGLRLSPELLAVCANICARLEGLPLAIELAAARLRLLTPGQLLERLDQRFALLAGGPRDLPERQQTLRQTIDWSCNLLGDGARRLLEVLAVCARGWTLETAEALAEATAAGPALDGLSELIDNHLVQRDGGAARFAMLETIREYAAGHLRERGAEPAARSAHARHFLELAGGAEQAMAGPTRHLWLQRLRDEMDNLRAALGWCVEAEPALAAAYGQILGRWWATHGMWREGGAWLERIAAAVRGAAPAIRAPVEEAWAALLDRQGRYGAAIERYQAALALYENLEEPAKIGALLVSLGWASVADGRPEPAMDYLGRALLLEADINDPAFRITVLQRRGTVFLACGRLTEAGDDLAAALALVRELGADHLLATVLVGLGTVALLAGDAGAARQLLAEGLGRRQRSGLLWGIAHAQYLLGVCCLLLGDLPAAREQTLASLGHWAAEEHGFKLSTTLDVWAALEAATGRPAIGARLLGAADAFRRSASLDAPAPADQIMYEQLRGIVRAALADEDYAAAWAEGERQDLWAEARRILDAAPR